MSHVYSVINSSNDLLPLRQIHFINSSKIALLLDIKNDPVVIGYI